MTTGQRVRVNLYGHTSPAEFEMANTDVLTSIDVDDLRNLSDRRNGHAAKTAAYGAR